MREDLMKSMDESAEEKKAELRQKSEQVAAKIREEARARADEVKKSAMADAIRVVESERNRSLYSVKNEVKKDLSALKYELFDRSFKESGKALSMIRNGNGYAACYRKLVEEALAEIDPRDVVLHIDPRDSELCGKVLGELGNSCDVMPDLDCAGGLNASSRDGKVIVFNTIESRLEKAKDRMKLEIFSTLYGD